LPRNLAIAIFAACSVAASPAPAVTNIFYPVADTSLLEVAPDSNLGGFVGMNSGSTQEYNRTRALIRFDLGSLPTNTLVLSAMLQLEVTRQPGEAPNNTTFGVHRMLRLWGEGNKAPVTQPGKGLPASPGEATWNCAFHPTNIWSVPGGAPDVDFSSIESSSQFIYGIGESPYRFESTPELVADVTAWVIQPASNSGWMLLCNDESSNFTARRFGAREDINFPPLLEIEYLVPPLIASVQRAGNQIAISFTGHAGQSYEVQYRDALATNAWSILTNTGPVTVTSPLQVFDNAGQPQRFYRLNTF